MDKQKIVSYVVMPLCIAAVCYMGYRMADVVLFNKAQGQMIISRAGQPELKVNFSSCRLVTNNGSNPYLLLSDEVSNGVFIYPNAHGQSSRSLTPVVQNRKLEISMSDCKFLNSTLELVSFRPRRFSEPIQSWKGSITANCHAPNVDISITADVHACQ
jgi:hypothetical protein